MLYRYLVLFLIMSQCAHAAEKRFSYSEELLTFWCEQVKDLPTYCYPYDGLEEILKKEGKSTLTLFSYGSLVDYGSARKTLSAESLSTREPALAFGVTRLFNRDVPIVPDSHWWQPCSPCARGMLNLELTGNLYDLVNGVNITIPLEEIEAVCKREVGYDLVPVVCAKWEQSTKLSEPDFCIAYTFRAPKGSQYTSANIYPRPGYYELTRNAAKQYGLLFYYLWLNTTYCPDGVTPITCWQEAVKAGRPETLVFYTGDNPPHHESRGTPHRVEPLEKQK